MQQSSNATISNGGARQRSLNMNSNFMPNIPSSTAYINNEATTIERVKSFDTISNNTFSSSATSSANTIIASSVYTATTQTPVQPTTILMSNPTAPMAIMVANNFMQRNNSIKSISKVLEVKFYFILKMGSKNFFKWEI